MSELDSILSKIFESITKDVVLRSSEGGNVLEVSSEDEFNKLVSSNKNVVVCFYKPDCPACKSYIPVFEEVSKEFKGSAVFIKVQTKNLRSVSKRYNVVAVPTTIVLVGGDEVSRYEGSMNATKLITFLIASGLKRVKDSG
jgi:thioredoxin-like negative regulator of GroEL